MAAIDGWAGAPIWAKFAGFPHAWDWAVREHDRGRPGKLAELVACGFQMTPEARTIVADILAGRRTPDLRGKHREKITPERMRDALDRLGNLREQRQLWMDDAEEIAERQRKEPAQVRRWIDREYGKAVSALAARYGISKRTLENLSKPSSAR